MKFVFDLETVPDLDLLRLCVDGPSEDPALFMEQAVDQLSRNKTGFFPPMFHRVVAWVGLWVEESGHPKNKVSWSGTDEKEGLVRLAETLLTYRDFGLVHHNGKGFDLPVITYRSMKHGLQLPKRLSSQDIRYRYSKENVDLVDEFTNYGASQWPKLKHLGHLLGIPVKQTGEGEAVDVMFREGQLEAIERYCYEDVMGTYLIWLHMRFTNGDMDAETFANLSERALAKLREIQG